MPTRPPTHTPEPADAGAADRARGSAHARGYDRGWRRLRLWHLARHPLCAHCERDGRVTAATDVHHVEKLAANPRRRLDPSNLQSLCDACHKRETAAGR
jgi:5-methylcytosine-specific restriction protein A